MAVASSDDVRCRLTAALASLSDEDANLELCFFGGALFARLFTTVCLSKLNNDERQ